MVRHDPLATVSHLTPLIWNNAACDLLGYRRWSSPLGGIQRFGATLACVLPTRRPSCPRGSRRAAFHSARHHINPATGKILETFDSLTPVQLEDKLAAAARCYEIWRHKTYAERAVILNKAAKLLHEQVNEFARTATLEMGKRINEARGEVEFSA
eukprot:gene4832-6579_t